MWNNNKEDSKMIQEVFRAARHNDLERLKTFIESGGVLPTITRGFGLRRRTLAHVAAKRGNLDILKYLVGRDPSILSDDLAKKYLSFNEPHTILETAVAYGHLDVVRYLVEVHGDDIFRERHFLFGSEQTPVILAISRGHLHVLKYFIEERHANVDTGLQDNEQRYHYYDIKPLMFVAYSNKRHNITNYLIEEKKANLTAVDKDNQNILYETVGFSDDLNFIKYILDEKKANIDINWRDKNGKTLLYKVVEFTRNLDILQYLVEQKKADVNIPEKEKSKTPLHEATQFRSYDIFKFLVDHGSDLEKKDKDGATPLHLTAAATSYFSHYEEYDKKFQYLLQHRANVKEKNNKGETPVDIILRRNRTTASKYLIDYMEDVNVRDDKGETLLHKVAIFNHTELLDYLVIKKHAKVDVTRTEDEWTPLHCAALWNHLAVCKYLIEHGANPLAKDKAGKNPAQVASKKEVINFIQNASSKLRNRRSLSPSVWMSAPHPRSHEHTLDHVSAHLNGGATITSVNETRPAFHFYSFLLLTNFFARYLFFSARTPPTDEYNFLGSPENSQNRMDPVAEEAVWNFLDVLREKI